MHERRKLCENLIRNRRGMVTRAFDLQRFFSNKDQTVIDVDDHITNDSKKVVKMLIRDGRTLEF